MTVNEHLRILSICFYQFLMITSNAKTCLMKQIPCFFVYDFVAAVSFARITKIMTVSEKGKRFVYLLLFGFAYCPLTHNRY